MRMVAHYCPRVHAGLNMAGDTTWPHARVVVEGIGLWMHGHSMSVGETPILVIRHYLSVDLLWSSGIWHLRLICT